MFSNWQQIRTQDLEIKRLSTIVIKYETFTNSDNRKWKPEVLETGQSFFIIIKTNLDYLMLWAKLEFRQLYYQLFLQKWCRIIQ